MATSVETNRVARRDAGASSDSTSDAWRAERGVVLENGGATFTLWAPSATKVVLSVATGDALGEHAMSAVEGEPGVLFAHLPGVRAAGFSTSVPWTGYDDHDLPAAKQRVFAASG